MPLLAALAAVGGLLAGVLAPPQPSRGSAPLDDADWALPDPRTLQRHDAGHLGVLAGLRWQGNRVSTPEPEDAPAATAWTLRGIVHAPAPRALVQVGNGPLQRIAPGEALPDGATLRGIGRNHIELERDGCAFQRRLHARSSEQSSGGDGCTEAPAPQEPGRTT